jgi:hypothetical protein
MSGFARPEISATLDLEVVGLARSDRHRQLQGLLRNFHAVSFTVTYTAQYFPFLGIILAVG